MAAPDFRHRRLRALTGSRQSSRHQAAMWRQQPLANLSRGQTSAQVHCAAACDNGIHYEIRIAKMWTLSPKMEGNWHFLWTLPKIVERPVFRAHSSHVHGYVSRACLAKTCSECGALPASRPKGIAGLGISEWTCSACGAIHDRDVNAARNIRAVGHGRLADEIISASAR